MSDIDKIDHSQGLPDALRVAQGGDRPSLSDGVAKILAFILREGECDVWIRQPHIEIRFSWLEKRKPSTYFGNLAPGVIAELMNFGRIERIDTEAKFSLGSGECRSGLYHFEFDKKWIYVKLEADQIAIRIRAKKSGLANPLPIFGD